MEQAKRLLDIPMIGSLDYVKKKSGQKALLISDQDTDHVYEEAVDRIVTSIRSEMSAEYCPESCTKRKESSFG